MTSPKPTKAQLELLRYMVAREDERASDSMGSRDREWRGGDIIEFYRMRKVATLVGTDMAWLAPHVRGGYANHGWRRAGGTALANLAKRGYADMIGFSIGVPIYVLTDEGRRIGSTD